MIRGNLNYYFKPERPAQVIKPEPSETSTEKTKPTLQNMHDLYKIFCEAEIITVHAGALMASIERRSEALKQYIEKNNLNIKSVDNLQHLFGKTQEFVRSLSSSRGGMAVSSMVDKIFSDYIENDCYYEPNIKLLPSLEELAEEYKNISGNNNLEYGGNNPDPLPEVDLKNIQDAITNNIKTSFGIF